jgi:small-conductance mechanosensitive channel
MLILLPLLRSAPVDLLQGAATALILLGATLLARRIAAHYFRRAHAAGRTDLMELAVELVSRTQKIFLVVVSVFVGLQFLHLPPRGRELIDSTVTLVSFWQLGVWGSVAVSWWLERSRRGQRGDDRAAASSLAVVAFIAKAVVWVMVALMALENLGVNITTLVAGLGVGGVAVALALQNILGDLFASLSITFDQPFFVGDSVAVDAFSGTVEHIGIKSTRLQSISGEEIVISNADLLKSRLRNYGRMVERRVLFTVGVTYETPMEILEQIPAIIRGIIEAVPDTRFGRSHFSAHGAVSLDFETVYYVLNADYTRHMDIQQEIHLKLHREFTRLGVEFAYPTQRLIMERAIAARPEAAPADV